MFADPEGVALSLTDKLLFEPGSAQLTRAGEVVLSQVGLMLTFASPDVAVSGHTDNAPSVDIDNYALSVDRGLTVLDYFIRYGLDQKRFSVAGYGPDAPLADNSTAEGRARNRRVDILLKTQPRVAGY